MLQNTVLKQSVIMVVWAIAGELLCLFPGRVEAVSGASQQWNGSTSMNWHIASNWDNNKVPESDSEVEIAADGNGTITIGNTDAYADNILLTSSADEDWEITGGSATLILDNNFLSIADYTISNESSYTLTISTDVSLSSYSLGGSKVYASGGDIIISGDMDFNAVDPYFDTESGREITTSGVLSGTSDVTKLSDGTWTISGSSDNTNSGSLTIEAGTVVLDKSSGVDAIAGDIVLNGGTLLLDEDDQIADTANMTLAGGTFDVNDNSEELGSLTLSLSSTLNLGSSSGDGAIIRFADSSSNTWSGSLTIEGWNGSTDGGGTDQIYFGNSSSGLTSSQLSDISFVNPLGFASGTYAATILATGEIVPFVPVPEASAWLTAFLLLEFVLVFESRRCR